MYKIAVLGERESIAAFSALGLDVFPVDTQEDARHAFHQLAKSGSYAIIYVTESWLDALSTDIEKYKDSAIPAVIAIPGRDGASGRGMAALDSAVERAVGANII